MSSENPTQSNTQSDNVKKDAIGVIGAGPAGLTAAYVLSKHGYKVELFEAGSSVGGMSKSLNLWGNIVDLGPHRFFTKDKRILKVWKEILEDSYVSVHRKTRILFRGKYYDYPLKPINILANLGIAESFLSILSYVKSLLIKPDAKNFEDWVIGRFGYRLYNTFFRGYSEKLWGISCRELDKEFASQRIKKFSLKEAILNSLKVVSSVKHNTTLDSFLYPKYGSGSLYEKMLSEFKKNSGNIHLNSKVNKVTIRPNGEFIVNVTGKDHNFKHLISTMPLTLLINCLNDVPEHVVDATKGLRFRNTILIYFLIDSKDLFEDQWLYIQDTNIKIGRVTNFNNWSEYMVSDKNKTILCAEMWCNFDDDIWSYDESLIKDIAKDELLKTGLVLESVILDSSIIKIPRCYPVYSVGYRDSLSKLYDYVSNISGLQVIGRYGAFKYNNQDHSILMGILAAENIIGNAGVDLTQINTDYEYQE